MIINPRKVKTVDNLYLNKNAEKNPMIYKGNIKTANGIQKRKNTPVVMYKGTFSRLEFSDFFIELTVFDIKYRNNCSRTENHPYNQKTQHMAKAMI